MSAALTAPASLVATDLEELREHLRFYYGRHLQKTSDLSEKACCTLDTSERYAREWLEHQTVAGWLHCRNPEASHHDRVFEMPEAYRPVLAEREDLGAQRHVGGLRDADDGDRDRRAWPLAD